MVAKVTNKSISMTLRAIQLMLAFSFGNDQLKTGARADGLMMMEHPISGRIQTSPTTKFATQKRPCSTPRVAI